jgi:hypothetical protein
MLIEVPVECGKGWRATLQQTSIIIASDDFLNFIIIVSVEAALALCSQGSSQSWEEWFKKNSPEYVTDIVPYSVWTAVPIQISFYSAYFTWSFTDLFLMLHGRALTARLKHFNNWLQKVKRITKVLSTD